MFTYAKTVLQKISTAVKEKYPQKIVSVIAFGSKVRGDHGEGSDFDVLVIVKEPSTEVQEGIIDIFIEEEMRSGISFDPVIKSLAGFELEKQHHTPFYENILNEGVSV